jgi:hypothetical protein
MLMAWSGSSHSPLIYIYCKYIGVIAINIGVMHGSEVGTDVLTLCTLGTLTVVACEEFSSHLR